MVLLSLSSIHLPSRSSKALEPRGKQSPCFRCLKSPSFSFNLLGSWDSRLCKCLEELGWVFSPRISSGSQFIRDYQGVSCPESSEIFAEEQEICLEPRSGLVKDVTAILGFEELIHPKGPVPVGVGIGAVQER